MITVEEDRTERSHLHILDETAEASNDSMLIGPTTASPAAAAASFAEPDQESATRLQHPPPTIFNNTSQFHPVPSFIFPRHQHQSVHRPFGDVSSSSTEQQLQQPKVLKEVNETVVSSNTTTARRIPVRHRVRFEEPYRESESSSSMELSVPIDMDDEAALLSSAPPTARSVSSIGLVDNLASARSTNSVTAETRSTNPSSSSGLTSVELTSPTTVSNNNQQQTLRIARLHHQPNSGILKGVGKSVSWNTNKAEQQESPTSGIPSVNTIQVAPPLNTASPLPMESAVLPMDVVSDLISEVDTSNQHPYPSSSSSVTFPPGQGPPPLIRTSSRSRKESLPVLAFEKLRNLFSPNSSNPNGPSSPTDGPASIDLFPYHSRGGNTPHTGPTANNSTANTSANLSGSNSAAGLANLAGARRGSCAAEYLNRLSEREKARRAGLSQMWPQVLHMVLFCSKGGSSVDAALMTEEHVWVRILTIVAVLSFTGLVVAVIVLSVIS